MINNLCLIIIIVWSIQDFWIRKGNFLTAEQKHGPPLFDGWYFLAWWHHYRIDLKITLLVKSDFNTFIKKYQMQNLYNFNLVYALFYDFYTY